MKKFNMITIIGETNAGKSTLVNALVGQKVSIVSRKVQTTIFNIMGVITEENTQIVLVDTPGFYREQSVRNYDKTAWDAFRQSELVMFVVDASKKDFEKSEKLISKIDRSKHIILILNKIDKIYKPRLLELINRFSQIREFDEVFLVSSVKLTGIRDLRKYLLDSAVESEWMFNPDDVTDQPMEVYTAEITREHIYGLLHQEIPYSCRVKTISIKARNGGGWVIQQEIFLQKEAHKSIFLGKNGSKIKAIGESARLELQKIMDVPIQLFLNVKVEKHR